jgi:hypothetical protein
VCHSGKATVYFFSELPSITKDRVTHISKADQKQINPDQYELLQFYLLEGTVIEARLDVRNSAGNSVEEDPLYDAYLIQGERNFASWKGFGSRYKMKLGNESELVYNVTKSDLYFFIVTNENIRNNIDVTVYFVILKTRFDLSEEMRTCNTHGNTCSFRIEFGSNDIAVIDIEYHPGGTAHAYNITTSCEPNIRMYVVCLVASPSVFLVFWCIMLWVCFRERKTEVPDVVNTPVPRRDIGYSIFESPSLTQLRINKWVQDLPSANGPSHVSAGDDSETENDVRKISSEAPSMEREETTCDHAAVNRDRKVSSEVTSMKPEKATCDSAGLEPEAERRVRKVSFGPPPVELQEPNGEEQELSSSRPRSRSRSSSILKWRPRSYTDPTYDRTFLIENEETEYDMYSIYEVPPMEHHETIEQEVQKLPPFDINGPGGRECEKEPSNCGYHGTPTLRREQEVQTLASFDNGSVYDPTCLAEEAPPLGTGATNTDQSQYEIGHINYVAPPFEQHAIVLQEVRESSSSYVGTTSDEAGLINNAEVDVCWV